ncbi:hypothetical protein [Paenibacillus sp. FSL R7-269]|nr:hypothetical protein [Paenibacillus sp. FSL R7-269]
MTSFDALALEPTIYAVRHPVQMMRSAEWKTPGFISAPKME